MKVATSTRSWTSRQARSQWISSVFTGRVHARPPPGYVIRGTTAPVRFRSLKGSSAHNMMHERMSARNSEVLLCVVAAQKSPEETLAIREPADEEHASRAKLDSWISLKSPSGKQLRPWAKILLLLSVGMVLISVYPRAASANAAAEGSGFSLVQAFKGFIDFILHLDVHLSSIIARHGTMTYALLFGIVFCETGLVLTPFLPGDSLLFVAGALAGLGKLNMAVVSIIFITAAILGDAVNYAVGAWLGQKAVDAKVISKSNIDKTEQFFKSYGGKTIVLARFVPIVRTFAPFVAGMSQMDYQKFAAFNIGGALLWTCLFCGTGYFFGNLPFVEKNFSLVVLAIVAISVLPIVYEILAARNHQANTKPTSSQSQA